MRNSKGFTLIELLMVILLVAILAAVAIPQFVDFQTDAKDGATQNTLGVMRTSIATQYGQMITRCGESPGTWPPADTIAANDITGGATPPCTVAEVSNPSDREFFAQGGTPENPWGDPPATNVVDCAAAGGSCSPDGTACDGATFTGGWCYDPNSGRIWPDSQNSPNDEHTF